jgi:glycine/D-amino acid oxidase-like deaminating enzyme
VHNSRLSVIDQVSGIAKVFAVLGHGRYGLSLSPMTGRLIANLIFGGPMTIDLQAFRMSRFWPENKRR